MNYGLVLVIASYLGAVQLATRTNTRPLTCSLVAVGIPYIAGLIITWVAINTHDIPLLANLFPLVGVVTIILQFIAAFIVFKKIQDEEGMLATIAWSTGGLILILMVIPFVAQAAI